MGELYIRLKQESDDEEDTKNDTGNDTNSDDIGGGVDEGVLYTIDCKKLVSAMTDEKNKRKRILEVLDTLEFGSSGGYKMSKILKGYHLLKNEKNNKYVGLTNQADLFLEKLGIEEKDIDGNYFINLKATY